MNQQLMTPIIELAGLPASGKTTAVSLLGSALAERGIRCHLIPEAASVAPIQHLKRHWFFNAWTLSTLVKEYLETDLSDEVGRVIVDRGFVDCLSWIRWFRTIARIDDRTAKALEQFATAPAWFHRTALTVVLRCSFNTALHRRGASGRILNAQTFAELEQAYDFVIAELLDRKEGPKLLVVDTDTLTPIEVRERIMAQLERLSVDAL